jgi:hypothetical protein
MVFICPKCNENPGSHSFTKIKEQPDGTAVFYTCPSKAKCLDDNEGIIAHYDGFLNENGTNPWILIFDSQGFKVEHTLNIKLTMDLVKLINDKYSENLKKIIIINPTWHINATIKMVMPFLSEKVRSLICKSKHKNVELTF